ncbi:Hsp20/alpha crystallin family protein [Paenibacillus alkalitolerans]|uniref:Hsp20/alpha crystallin family protein n=1 Tax=Paenibacillus alkalitolerans TaxID=2799335 RepID=UPI0018F3109F|nr:Hsp20/alpha crystallin family protein [Paenibacillus alkalitolerans]
MSGFDWKSFENFFGGKLPDMPGMNGDFNKWVEDYVQSILKKSFTPTNGNKKEDLSYKVLETDKHIIIKTALPENVSPNDINIRAGANQIKISGLPNNRSQNIILPSVINHRKCRAQFKKRNLHIKAPKMENQELVNISVNYE